MLGVRASVLVVAVGLSVICVVVLSRPPQPTVIEKAQNSAELEKTKSSWGPTGCARVGFALGFDYLFMAAYVTALGLGCVTVAHRSPGLLRNVGLFLGYAQIFSGLIDATENAALIRLLVMGFDDRWMQVARLATASKLIIPISGFAYIFIVWPLSRWLRR